MKGRNVECFQSLTPDQLSNLTETLVMAVVAIWFLGHILNFAIKILSGRNELDDLEIAIETTIRDYDKHQQATGHWVKTND